MEKNIYWSDALASGEPITLEKVGAGSIYKCGEANVFWHGQESAKADDALAAAIVRQQAKKAIEHEQCLVCHVVFTASGCRCVPGFI